MDATLVASDLIGLTASIAGNTTSATTVTASKSGLSASVSNSQTGVTYGWLIQGGTFAGGSTTTSGAFGTGVRPANSGNNITIQAYSFNTTNTATDILVAGAYAGAITVTIAAGT